MARLVSSFRFAWQGVVSAFRSEPNLRIHFLAICLTIPAGLFFTITSLEWVCITICAGIVLAAELFNTALEKLVDLVSPDFNPLAGKIKDIAAGAVLICSVCALIVGLVIFIPRILAYAA
jgi:diacylglycerol kinase (ATP)